jgi:hypothetical protein
MFANEPAESQYFLILSDNLITICPTTALRLRKETDLLTAYSRHQSHIKNYESVLFTLWSHLHLRPSIDPWNVMDPAAHGLISAFITNYDGANFKLQAGQRITDSRTWHWVSNSVHRISLLTLADCCQGIRCADFRPFSTQTPTKKRIALSLQTSW